MGRVKGFKLDMSISQSDFNLLNKKLNRLKRESKTGLDLALRDTSKKMEEIAKSRVVVDTGKLKQSISSSPVSGGYEFTATKKYAPYIEFGTGGLVDVEDAAKLGVPPSLIKQIFQGKRKHNMHPQPFFYSSARMAFQMLKTKLETDYKRFVR